MSQSTHNKYMIWKGNLICNTQKTYKRPIEDRTNQFKISYRLNPKKKWKECIEKVYYLNDTKQ